MTAQGQAPRRAVPDQAKGVSMKIIILAGGYAKRMWPLTEDRPKPLLPVAGRPIIEHILDRIKGIDAEVIISTNQRFGPAFREWIGGVSFPRPLKLVTEPTVSESGKLGAVAGLNHVIQSQGIEDDVLVIGGDNMFGFEIDSLLEFQRERGSPVVACHDLKDADKARDRFGVCELDQESRVINFQEKSPEPASALASTCIYYFPREVLPMIAEYLEGENNPDATGFFIDWLRERTPVHGFVFREPWHDIGSPEIYEEASRDT